MPSAAAVKVEKIPLVEDPGKQFLQILDKKQRNLEKRKIKLDNYRHDVELGKELNEDQKIAVSKYDSVIQLLDFTKELTKAVTTINQECGRQQKKQAKKEQVERQQFEIQRLKEALLYCHFLSCFQNEDVRSDFLNGENGAMQLSSDQLSQLTQLYKIIGPELPTDQSDIENHFHVLAENHIFLVEGRNKEIAGTTYKALRDLLQSIKACGYFSRPTESVDDDVSSDDLPEEEAPEIVEDVPVANGVEPEVEVVAYENGVSYETAAIEEVVSEVAVAPVAQNGPLQEVLSAQGSFNFLQESQIDLDAPHMDPAVVAVHQMPPPNFPTYPSPEAPPLVNGAGTEVHPEPTPVSPTHIAQTAVPAPDFDPTHPIPTQTFTNQSFAVMQNMMPYVPVTLPLGTMAPIAVVSGGNMVPVVAVAPIPGAEGVVEVQVEPEMVNNVNSPEAAPITSETPNDKGHENTGFNGYRNNFRGRGRGRGGGYYRGGRSNYHNHNGRGGYQNNYYQDRNGYNPNFRRGNNRGGPRGGNGGNNHRGRGGNYNNHNRPQNNNQQTHQQPPQQQQA